MPERTRWGAVAALFIAGVVAALQIGKASIAVPVLQRELLLSLVVASWVIGAYGVLGAVAGLPSGILASLFSARRTLIAGLLAAGLGSLAGALSTHGGLLILTRIIEGCGFLAAVLALPRLLGAVTAPKDRDTVFAIWGAYMPVGSLVMLLGGPQLLAFGWQSLWVVNGVVAIVYAALVALLPLHEEMHAGNPGQALLSNIKQALGSSGPVLLALAFGVYTFQYSALAGLLPTLLVDRMGLSVAVAGAISAATVAANAIGNLAAGAQLLLRGRSGTRHLLRKRPCLSDRGAGVGESCGDGPDTGVDFCSSTAFRPKLRTAGNRTRSDQPGQQSGQPVWPRRDRLRGTEARLGLCTNVVLLRHRFGRNDRVVVAPCHEPREI